VEIKRFIIGTVVGGIALYILGYVIWELVFADFFAANDGSAIGVAKDPQVIWALALGSLCYAALLTLAIGTRLVPQRSWKVLRSVRLWVV